VFAAVGKVPAALQQITGLSRTSAEIIGAIAIERGEERIARQRQAREGVLNTSARARLWQMRYSYRIDAWDIGVCLREVHGPMLQASWTQAGSVMALSQAQAASPAY